MPDAQQPGRLPARPLLGTRTMKIRLAVASGLVLSLGAWLTPRVAPAALSAPREHAAPLLEEQVQLRETVVPFRGVQEVAARVREHSVAIRIPGPQRLERWNDFSETAGGSEPSGHGVVITDGYVLTHAMVLAGRSSVQIVTADGRTLEGRVDTYEPSTGLVLLQSDLSVKPSVTFATEPPSAGELAVAVGLREARHIAVPLFVTSVEGDRYTVGAVNDSVVPGMPLYNLDGQLFAMAADKGQAHPIRDVVNRLIASASGGERKASLGVGFQGLVDPLSRAVGAEMGVLVNDVVDGGPAHLAGIQVGDVIVAVGDVEIDSVPTAIRALGSLAVGSPTPIRLRRNGRVRAIDAMPALAYEIAALAEARRDEAPSGPEARVVIPGPLLDRAGIPGTARVLSINGRAVTSVAQAQRQLRRSGNLASVLLQDGDDRFFVAIEPRP